MSLSCNAIGDVLALIELAIVIARFLNDCRGTPAECRALCNELRSLERLLALSKPTILALRDEALREIVTERLRIVSTCIEEGLQLIVKFGSAFDVSAVASPAQSSRTTLLRWVTKTFQRVEWTLRRSADAEACRVAIAQSFEPLIFSLLVRSAFQADQKAVLGALQETFTDLADEVKAGYATMHDLTGVQAALRADTLFLKEAFDRHLAALLSVREDVSNVRAQFADTLAATRLDIADVRRRLEAFCSTVDTVAQNTASTRATLEAFTLTVSGNRVADRSQLASMDTKLDQMMELLAQQAEKTSKRDQVQKRGIPGLRQLRAAATRAQDLTPHLLSAVTRAILSDETITTSIALAMTGSSGTDQVAYGVAAALLVVARKACELYKTPVVVHVVFVEDFFGFALEIPVSKCSNPMDFHAALTGNFEGRMGLVLIQRRKYELQLVDSPTSTQQVSPWRWERSLEPGARIHMNTFIRHHRQLDQLSNSLICPSCSAQVIDPDDSSAQDCSWVACSFCRTMVQVTRQRAAAYNAQKVEDLPESPVDESATSTRSMSNMRISNNTSTGDSEEQAALRRCRRIRIIQQILRENFCTPLQQVEESTGRVKPEPVQVDGLSHVGPMSTAGETPNWGNLFDPQPAITLSIPTWLAAAVAELQNRFEYDKFMAIHRIRGPIDSGGPLPDEEMWRLKCIDCPGKLYKPGPGDGLTNFEVHLRNPTHRLRVRERCDREQNLQSDPESVTNS